VASFVEVIVRVVYDVGLVGRCVVWIGCVDVVDGGRRARAGLRASARHDGCFDMICGVLT